jgi:cell division protein FtsB
MSRNSGSFFQRLFQWRFFFVVNLVIIVLLSLSFGRQFVRDRDIQKEISELQAQADELMAKNISITELQTAVQTKSFIEREARLKLGMKKQGESVVVIKEVAYEEGEDLSTDLSDPLGLVLDEMTEVVFVPNHTKWWYYFFNKKEFKKIKG